MGDIPHGWATFFGQIVGGILGAVAAGLLPLLLQSRDGGPTPRHDPDAPIPHAELQPLPEGEEGPRVEELQPIEAEPEPVAYRETPLLPVMGERGVPSPIREPRAFVEATWVYLAGGFLLGFVLLRLLFRRGKRKRKGRRA